MRTIAIGDVHGCSIALRALLQWIDAAPDDVIVLLGDYIDRGPDSRGVIELLLELGPRTTLVPLVGNHELMFFSALEDMGDRGFWLQCGGAATLRSYGPSATAEDVPEKHVEFMRACRTYYESDTHFFTHAGYRPELPLDQQSEHELFWMSLRDEVPGPHRSGKIAVVGHTSQKNGEILELGHLRCIDTFCHGGGWLTAIDAGGGDVWQVDIQGNRRI